MDLNITWFVLVAVLITGYAILDGFDFGVGILSLFARSDDESRVHMNSIGPVWDGNEVWLLTGGGALFAAFPMVYATAFSALYLALMLLLVALITRAVSFEFRSKVEAPAWRKTWDLAFGISSLLPPILYGVAIGNVMRGIPMDEATNYTGTFFDLLNPYALVFGVLTLVMMITQGAMWLAGKSEGALEARMWRMGKLAWIAWMVMFGVGSVTAALGTPELFATGVGRPLVWVALVLMATGFGLVGVGIKGQASGKAFLGASVAVAGQILVFGFSLFPNLLPALGTGRSLDIYNASSSQYSLGVMLVIAVIGMPLVIGYTIAIYRVFRGKVALDEHSY